MNEAQMLEEFKCPSCGGAVTYDASIQKLKCPYCDTEFDVSALKEERERKGSEFQDADDMTWQTMASGTWQEGEEEQLRSYICRSCGGEIIGDENTAATSCPFCGNPVVMTGVVSGVLKPDLVIPFRLDKEAAKRGLQKHLSGKHLMPKLFKTEAHIDEIKGIYVPFWLFDADADASLRYHGTRVRTWGDSNYIYTETSHYSILREGSLSFEKVPVDGSSKLLDELMESIEPYDYREAVDFQTAYLAGYFADKYDVDAESSIGRANMRVKNSTVSAFAQTVQGYSSLHAEHASVHLKNGSSRYALLPVWLLGTTWKGEQYIFAMNGQTGKFVGDLPLDKGAFARWLIGLGIGISAVVLLLMYLFGMVA